MLAEGLEKHHRRTHTLVGLKWMSRSLVKWLGVKEQTSMAKRCRNTRLFLCHVARMSASR